MKGKMRIFLFFVVRVATEMPMTDDLPSERVDRVTSFSPIERFSVGAEDIMTQESDNESMWFLLLVMT